MFWFVFFIFTELGILHWVLDADNYETDPDLKHIRKERGYSYEDFVDVSPEALPNYETKIKNFYEEHIHTDEEIRYCLDGSGECFRIVTLLPYLLDMPSVLMFQ